MVKQSSKNEKRKQITRLSLLEAASLVFVEKGYHQTLIADIVGRAGVGQGTFYRYFQSKRSIFDTLFELTIERLLNEFEDMQHDLPSNYDEYYHSSVESVEAFTKSCLKQRDLILLFLKEGHTIDKDFDEKLKSVYRQFAFVAGILLDHAIDSGFARQCDTDFVSKMLVGIAVHLIKELYPKNEDEIHNISVKVVDFAFKGFGKFKPNRSKNDKNKK